MAAVCWVRFALPNLLVLFLLFAQAGALAHGVKHVPDQFHGDEPACDLCLAYAPMGAGVASTPLPWVAPTATISFDAAVPAASPTGFRPGYQSRAPPAA
ncbi:MAG: hypothetical protein Q8O33_08650 [Pseudomonadota bacterium]|nr:hypothetical protein [Pseudomonadota bacterium]